MSSDSKSVHLDIVDFPSIFSATESLAKALNREKLNINLAALRTCCDKARHEFRLPPATDHIALGAADLASEPQARFFKAVEKAGFDVELMDFRDAFRSNPAGQVQLEKTERTTYSLDTRIAYVLGTLTPYAKLVSKPSIIVVSHAFELQGPMIDLADRGAIVCIAYFRSLLDPRFERRGLLRPDSPIRFYDLETDAEQLIGASLLSTPTPTQSRVRISRF